MSIDLYKIRTEYAKQELSVKNCDNNPLTQLTNWLQEAMHSNIVEPTAMSISTVAQDNRPSSRIVLLKEVADSGLIFFSNYNSRKGEELELNPYISVNMFWPELERQIRVEGKVTKLDAEESDKYFITRPYLSKIGAWASMQSKILDSQDILLKRVEYIRNKFKVDVPRPKFWGGYKVLPDYFEFWQGRPNRLHDRIIYILQSDTNWEISRLYP